MIDPTTVATIGQKKMDSLCAKHLHVARQERLECLSRSVDIAAIGVPGFYFVFRLMAKGTPYGPIAEVVWEVLAGTLILAAIVKMGFRWQERADTHSRLLGENIGLVRLADSLLVSRGTATQESAELFLVLAGQSEKADRAAIGNPTGADMQWAWREGAKEYSPHSRCDQCGASPWKFVPGTCQQCGGTPVSST